MEKVTYKGTWLDSSNVAYVWFKSGRLTYKLYNNGTGSREGLPAFNWKFNSPTEIILS